VARLGAGSSSPHTDWLGSTRLLTGYNPSGAPATGQTCTNLPFGDGLSCNSYIDILHFTGKERDSESGLDDFDVRYYASSMGRFMRPDPAQWAGFEHKDDPQAWNGYAYGLIR
jgi:RHS repeat-associated protein